MRPFRYIGKKRRTQEDPRFVSGRGCFVADVALPGMKHVALVASPHASARIASIGSLRATSSRPTSSSHITIASENTSLRPSSAEATVCSGDMYAYLPLTCPGLVS